ncbi:MAG: DUF4252 domain-containing protein [bacterium]
MKTKIFTTVLFLLFIFVTVYSQEIDITKHPGYIDLEMIEIPESAGEITDISLGPAMLRMFKSFGDNERGLKNMDGLLSIRVKSFEIDSEVTKKIEPIINNILVKLENDKWEQLVRVKDKDERTVISMRYEKNRPVGLLIMSYKPYREVTFANIVGHIDIGEIARMGMGFSNSTLDSLKDFEDEFEEDDEDFEN